MTIKITFPNSEPLKNKNYEDKRNNYDESEFLEN